MIVKSIKHANLVFERLFSRKQWVAVDTETQAAPGFPKDDALVFGRARIKIFSMCHRGEAYSFPTNMYDPSFPLMSEYAEALMPYAEREDVVKVFHNANYDLNVFWTSTSVKRWPKLWDTMIGAWMANVAIEKGLKSRAPLYNRNLGSLFISKEMKKAGFDGVRMEVLDEVATYAEEDVILTDELYQMQHFGFILREKVIRHVTETGSLVVSSNPMPEGKVVVEGEGKLTPFRKTWIKMQELPYLKATLRAERRGFPYSVKKARANRAQCAQDKDVLLRDLYKAAGQKINLNSGPQIVKHIFEPHGIECPFRTRKGKVSLNAGALFKMRDSHPLVAKLERYRKLSKLQEVYLGDPDKDTFGLEHFVDKDGRIHCTMNTIGAVTGRTSAQNPNLTQIPSKADIYSIKDSFEAPKGKVIVCLDYAQLEIRIMAILCKDPAMQKILRDSEGDIHQNTADQFAVDRSPTAKQLNFLMLYGGLEYMLAEKLTIEGVPTTKEQARAYIERYNQVYYRVKEFREELLAQHKKNGYVRLLTGRRRWLDDIDWEDWFSVHKAETTLSNNTVQGSGQDLLKAAIIRCDPQCLNVDKVFPQHFDLKSTPTHKAILRDYAVKIEKVRRFIKLAKVEWILQVHDEAVFFADESAGEEALHTISDVMTWRHFFPPTTSYNVPLVAEGGVGYTWQHSKNKVKSKTPPLFHHIAGFN